MTAEEIKVCIVLHSESVSVYFVCSKFIFCFFCCVTGYKFFTYMYMIVVHRVRGNFDLDLNSDLFTSEKSCLLAW